MEIKSNTTGFLKDAAYNYQLSEALTGYEDQFGNAEKITVNLSEVPSGFGLNSNQNPVKISQDGKEIVVDIPFQKFYRNGKLFKTPTPKEVYDQMTNVLDNAVKEYKEKFSSEK
jgi:hypothetical protein